MTAYKVLDSDKGIVLEDIQTKERRACWPFAAIDNKVKNHFEGSNGGLIGLDKAMNAYLKPWETAGDPFGLTVALQNVELVQTAARKYLDEQYLKAKMEEDAAPNLLDEYFAEAVEPDLFAQEEPDLFGGAA
ncbi:MAG: hypothetical protein K2W95_01005 [Candidatus Obscuribacterales bacterium]|nr:hypothetical protein [Candidatus Obscuribacterales bacterium]